MSRTCVFCGKAETAFLELCAWDELGQRARDVIGGICSDHAGGLRLHPKQFLDDDLPMFEPVPDVLKSRYGQERLMKLAGLWDIQFRDRYDHQWYLEMGLPSPERKPLNLGCRVIPFTHPIGLRVWQVRRKEEDRNQAKVNSPKLPEIIRATDKEHEEIVEEAIREAFKA